MTCFACVASGDIGSAAITFSIALIVASLSPFFRSTRASFNSGLLLVGSSAPAFWEPAGARERLLQILRGEAAERAGRGRRAALLQREGDRRIRGANRLHVEAKLLGREAGRLGAEGPRAGFEADDRETALVVGGRREA